MAATSDAARDLLDSGATHYVHPSDAGAIEGSWRPDVDGLVVGDGNLLPAFGSVEKRFMVPSGGPDVVRRVLICPGVCTRVFSHSAEVDLYKSTIVDAPGEKGATLTLQDGRTIPVFKAKNGLRRVCMPVRLDSPSCAAMASAGLAMLALASATPAHHDSPWGVMASLAPNRITVGVGKPSVQLNGLETLWLWHHRLAHLPLRALLAHLRHSGLWPACNITRADQRAFARQTCDDCNAYKQRRKAKLRVRWASDCPLHRAHEHLPSVPRALRPLMRVLLDIFGPVRWPSAQHQYVYLIGWWCQATGMRWVQGTKTHTAEVVEEWNQRMRAALRFTLGEIEIIRTDGATEFGRSHDWPEYLADCSTHKEQSVAYDPTQMGGVERVWGVSTPDTRCTLASAKMGRRHWYSCYRHMVFLSNINTRAGTACRRHHSQVLSLLARVRRRVPLADAARVWCSHALRA